MEKVVLAPEEFSGLVEVFRILRKWRDENNQNILAEESVETKTDKETKHEQRSSN